LGAREMEGDGVGEGERRKVNGGREKVVGEWRKAKGGSWGRLLRQRWGDGEGTVVRLWDDGGAPVGWITERQMGNVERSWSCVDVGVWCVWKYGRDEYCVVSCDDGERWGWRVGY